MMRFLTLLLGLIERFFAHRETVRIEQDVRGRTIKEINDAINERVEQAEAAVAVPDAERDERLRSRFDRSRSRGAE